MILTTKFHRIHMIGIGGAGMSGIAEVLHNLGFEVSGSDLQQSAVTQRLEQLGIRITYGHRPENVQDAQVVVYSSAIRPENPELVAARRQKIPVIPRAEMLAELMRMKYSIAVSGAHGKTTTTSMIGHMLAHVGLSPTIVVGGKIRGIGSGAVLGKSRYLVAEADESDASFLKLFPTLAVVTNIDKEHLDHYGNFIRLLDAFLDFVNRVPFYGAGILNIDDPYTREIAEATRARTITYGFREDAMIRATEVSQEGLKTHALLWVNGEKVGQLSLSIPGVHNLQNALAAIAVAWELEVNLAKALEALQSFHGVMRRFEIKGTRDGVNVIDDYAHHPTEIRRVLETARSYWSKGRIVVVFQPHRYTRTALLYREFAEVLTLPDVVILTPIYPAGEDPLEGVSTELILAHLSHLREQGVYAVETLDQAKNLLNKVVQPGDLVLTLGAGDVYRVGEEWLKESHES